jgi:hypothetical protein
LRDREILGSLRGCDRGLVELPDAHRDAIQEICDVRHRDVPGGIVAEERHLGPGRLRAEPLLSIFRSDLIEVRSRRRGLQPQQQIAFEFLDALYPPLHVDVVATVAFPSL